MSKPVAAILWCVALVASAATTHAAVEVRLHPGGIDLRPDGAYQHAVLTLSTPDGRVYEESFAGARQPGFELAGKSAPDGVYAWRLEIFPGPGADRSTAEVATPRLASSIDSGTFRVTEGAVILGGVEPDGGAAAPAPGPDQPEDQVIPDDLIVQGSVCVGFDCVNNESFGFDTIRMKENNTRIKFDDTSTSAGFPNTDWQLTANDSASGGANKFSIEDTTTSRIPFTLRGGAPTDSLFVDSSGRLGLGTSTPVLRVHEVASDTPSFRFEQNGSGGFTPQTWDVAGNEANFFVRDVTGGSRLPFRIQPGAPTNSIYIGSTGNVGLGLTGPSAKLHVSGSDGATKALIQETSATNSSREVLELQNNGQVALIFEDTSVPERWTNTASNTFLINNQNNTGVEFRLANNGDLTILGSLTQGSDRNRKHEITPVDSGHVLDRVLALPLATWKFRADALGVRHLGPMAQDFSALFGLGADDTTISPLDVAGVGLAAIQALHTELEQREAEIRTLRDSNQELARRLAEIERAVERLAGR